MHTDGQSHGSNLFGYEGSCPRLLRVLYYLDELTAERAPFRLIPRSHLSFHAEASPYARYKWHPEEITLVGRDSIAIDARKSSEQGRATAHGAGRRMSR